MKSEVSIFQTEGDVVSLAAVARLCRGQDPIVQKNDYKTTALVDEDRAAELRERARKTLEGCFNAGHFSVFEFAGITFLVHCPIFVARQLMRYRSASYMERSLRTCSPFEEVDGDEHYLASLGEYKKLVENGEKKESARRVLTVSTPTEFLMKVNLRELFHIFDERLSRSAQAETRDVVFSMYESFRLAFPEIESIYNNNRRKVYQF